jgi:transcriptional regulator with XRE-family HTH domain
MTGPAEAKQQNTADAVSHESDMGLRIRQAREEARFSQEDVAAALGITVGAVSQWENRWTLPSRSSLLAFAHLTGADPAWLESGVGSVTASRGTSPPSVMTVGHHGSRRVPIITAARAIKTEKARLARLLPVRTKGWVTPYYWCSPQSFAFEIFDRHNVPEFQMGEIVVIDTDEAPVTGDMVLAVVGADHEDRPVFARYLSRPPQILLQPLGQHEEVEVVGPGHLHGRIVGTMVEHIRPRRSSPTMSTRKLSADADPRFFSVFKLLRMKGEAVLRQRLEEIDNAADLQALAKKEQIGLPRELRRPGADVRALRAAIINKASERVKE